MARTVPESKYLNNATVYPYKLKLEGDSLRFEVQGNIPIASVMAIRNSKLKLYFVSQSRKMELGEIPLIREGTVFRFEKGYSLFFEDWMLGASLELQFVQQKRSGEEVLEKRLLTKGVLAPQLMVKLGEVYSDEPIPEVGAYILSGQTDKDAAQKGEFVVYFDPGASQLKKNAAYQSTLNELDVFLQNFPLLQSFKITGLQSPETSEGKSSQLGMARASAVKKGLADRLQAFPDSLIRIDSRWNDWFDLRLLLRDYEGISTQRKDEMYAVLMNRESFQDQYSRLVKIPGFSQVQKDLFPKLRAVKIEIVAKPRKGLTMEQTRKLNVALKNTTSGSLLTLEEWIQAAEATNSLDEKALIYSKMTEYFHSPLPYNNMAVVRMRQAQRTLDYGSKEILWDEADRLLVQAYRVEANPYSLHNQGQILALKGNYWDAYKKLSEASVGIQNKDLVRRNEALRGALDILRGDYKLATLRFDYEFSDPKDYFNKGLAFYLIEDFSEANAAFEESVILGRSFGYGYYGLAMIAAGSGQAEIALIHLKRAVESNRQLAEKAFQDPVFQELRETEEFFSVFNSRR
ncbi:TPR end-of-group domain-containing protein [Algoriphagus confluentis]|uniref:TPR end-of-group domain-containing protein n=1 Tax=Algoriphagus confluentis TaxID=1697556 RepID=UPI0030C781C8